MRFLIALLIGAASAFAFQPTNLWPLMPVAFAFLCVLIERAPRLRSALAIGWGFGVGQFCVGLNWIATAFTFQAAMPAWLGWVAVVLLSLYLAVYPMLAVGLAWRFGQKSRLALVLALAGSWAVCEWLRATMFTGFAWNPVGAALVDTELRSVTRLIGTYGLSGMLVLVSGAAWLLSKREWRSGSAIVIGSAILVAIAGLTVPPIIDRPSPAIRIVQPNIGQQDKWRPGFDQIAAERLDRLTIQGSPRTRIIFWPEAAVTDPLVDTRALAGPAVLDRRLAATRTLGADDILMTGGLALSSRDQQTLDGAANSVFVMAPLGRMVGRYDKAHLVPYGEYLPMRPLLGAIGLSRLAPGDLDFNAGPGPQTVDLPSGLKVGFQLCYEIIFSGEVVDRRHRPDFIFNPSNDAWFGRWGPPQHLAQARLRATEEGLPIIRSTPTGISALVDAEGELLISLPWRKAGVIDAVLPAPRAPTLFASLGNIIPLGLGFLLLLTAIALDRRRRYRQT